MTMRLFSLFLLLKASTLTDAFTYMAETACSNFTFTDEGAEVVRELCFSLEGYGPSPAATISDNGTEVIEYIGGYSEFYSFKSDLDGLTTSVAWEEEVMEGVTQPCVANVNGENCTSCTICEDGTSLSADCTNLDQGRNVDCETFPPFFPFMSTYEYMGTVAPSDGATASSTGAGQTDDDLSSDEPAASPGPDDSGTASPTASTAASFQKVGVAAVMALASSLVVFSL